MTPLQIKAQQVKASFADQGIPVSEWADQNGEPDAPDAGQESGAAGDDARRDDEAPAPDEPQWSGGAAPDRRSWTCVGDPQLWLCE